MASTLDYIEFVCTQLEKLSSGIIIPKKMFGDYMIYIDGKPIILVCDNICYVKMVNEIKDLMADAEIGTPYQGAKEHYILDIEHLELCIPVIRILQAVIPIPKSRKKQR